MVLTLMSSILNLAMRLGPCHVLEPFQLGNECLIYTHEFQTIEIGSEATAYNEQPSILQNDFIEINKPEIIFSLLLFLSCYR